MKRGKGKTEAGRAEKTGGRRKDARKKIIQRRRSRTDERKMGSEKEEERREKGIKDGNEKTESEKGGKINFHTVICHDVS